jgi:hypothetical protein
MSAIRQKNPGALFGLDRINRLEFTMRLHLCLLLSIALLFGQTVAEEASFFPTDDSYVRRDEPFSNFGDGPTLRLRNNRFDAFLKFSVTGVESEINSVKLVLTVAGPGEDGGTLYLVDNNFVDDSGPWTEEALNENNSPPIFGTPLTSIGAIPVQDAKVEIDLSTVVTGNGVYSFAITSTSDTETKYYSKENIHTTDFNPVLLVDATIGNEPDDPVAAPDSKTTLEWTSVEIDILANDTDSDGSVDPTTVSITVPSNSGSEVVNAVTGVLTYTPDPGFSGTDVIKYTVKDDEGNTSNEATVTITVEEAQFTNVTAGAGVNDPAFNWGATFNDFNRDGLVDLYVTTHDAAANKLFINNGNGTFTNLASQQGVAAASRICLGVASSDYNNDGYLDILVATDAANILYRGGATGFTDRSLDGISASGAYSYAPAWGDYDNDGYADLYIGNWNLTDKLYRNSGPASWSFSDVTDNAGISGIPQSRSAAWSDYDKDGDLDLFVCQGYSLSDEPDLLYNNDDGVFTDVAEEAGLTADLITNGAAWGDYDNDGDPDLALAVGEGANKLYRNDNGLFTDVSSTTGIGNSEYDCPSVAWFDYDNDGDLDLFFTQIAGANNLLFENQGGNFAEKQDELGLGQDTGYSQGFSLGDYNNDGFLDIYIPNWRGGNTLFRNRGNSNNWIIFKLIGTLSNTAAIGARVRIVADGSSQTRQVDGGSNSGSQHSLPVEFGLGTATVIDSVIINWPSGIVQSLAAVSIKRIVTIVEPAACEPGVCEGPSIFPADSSGIEGIPIESVTSDTVYVDVRVKQNPEIDAFGFVVHYDTTVLKFVSSENGSLTQGFAFLDVNEAGGGRIVCGGANDDPISANSPGSLVRLTFAVECIQGQEAAISISGLADDVSGMAVCCNIVICRSCRSDGDVNDNNGLSPGDALAAFRIFLFDQTLPPELDVPDFDCELEAADVNCNGQVTPGDALEIFRAFLNEQPPSDCFASDVAAPLAKAGNESGPQLFLGNEMVRSNTSLNDREFRIIVSGKELASVDAFGFDLTYPSEQMKFVRVERGELTANWTQISAVELSAGRLRVGGYDASEEARISEGDFVILIFQSAGAAISGQHVVVDDVHDDFEYAEISTNFTSSNVIPAAFALHQNYPNPFNPETDIRFDIPILAGDKVPVMLAIYNLRGQRVRTLVDEERVAGAYTATWDGKSDAGLRMSTGTYFYRIEAGDFIDVKRMVLVR